MNNIKELQAGSDPTELGSPAPGAHVALIVSDEPQGEIAVPRPRENPVRVHLMKYSSPRTQQTIREALLRIERVALVQPGTMAWERLTYEQTTAIHAELGRHYARRTVKLTTTILRGLLETCYHLAK